MISMNYTSILTVDGVEEVSKSLSGLRLVLKLLYDLIVSTANLMALENIGWRCLKDSK